MQKPRCNRLVAVARVNITQGKKFNHVCARTTKSQIGQCRAMGSHDHSGGSKARAFCPSIADFVKSEFGFSLVLGCVSVKSYSVFHNTVLTDLELFWGHAFASLHVER